MRTLPPALAAHVAARNPMITRQLVWVSARNRGTGATETLGLWTGEYNGEFVINGVPRSYYGAGPVLQMPEITMQAGLEVRTHSITLSALSPEVELLMRGYDVRAAPIEIHRAVFDPAAPHTLIAEPVSMFTGWVDGVTFNEAAEGGEFTVDVTIASHSRGLTIPLRARRSDESYKLRSGDRFGRFSSVSGAVTVYWGQAYPSAESGKKASRGPVDIKRDPR